MLIQRNDKSKESIMKRAIAFAIVFLISAAVLPSQLPAEENSGVTALMSLKADYPDLRTYREGPVLSRLYGTRFGTGSTPTATAEQFIVEHSAVYGLGPDELKPGSDLVGGLRTLPLMYNQDTGEYKFTLVYYSQYLDEIPVFRADLGLLVRNEPGYPLVMASSALRDLGDFSTPVGVGINPATAQNAANAFLPDLNNFSEPRLVIWAGVNDQYSSPAAATEIIADNGRYAMADYEKWLFLVDAQSGELLYTEDLIVNTDVIGNVSGLATEGWGADICSTVAAVPLPYTRVSIEGREWAYADENGDFVIPNDDDTEVTVDSYIRGQWFRVFNQSGTNAHLDTTVIPPGPINFVHNERNISEYNRAEVNGYVHANVVRDFVLTYHPTYPTIYQQTEFPVNVNLNDNCNAYYDYSSINFFTAGGGCSNTAFSTVVHHEYGHHLVSVGGSGQGQYGEGLGDVMGVLISDKSGLAYGFFGNCSVPMRDADNSIQYPCNGPIHDCGRLLSGCIWSTRNELMVNYPDDYIDILSSLLVNSIPLHRGDLITPGITIDFLVLDDDDGDIDNGTPHYDEICAGFGDHNMDCPEIVLLQFEYPDGLPELVDPAGETTIGVEVVGVTEEPQPGTGKMYYDIGPGWIEMEMEEISANVYEVTFPETECGIEVLYYFSAETVRGALVTDPSDAPASVYATISATAFITVFEDDFESDLRWTVVNACSDGEWERGIPAGGGDRGDPPADYDGSGNCYLTDNVYGNSDVDDGITYLISPAVDLTDMGAIVKYALWYTNGFGDDPYNDVFNIWISDDDGSSWTLVETIGPESAAGWMELSFVVNDYITPTNQVRVRFEASDLNAGSIVEAAIDAFEIVSWECDPTFAADDDRDLNLPDEYALIGSYPNPFNAKVTIEYALPEQSDVAIEIYDLLGRMVETLVSKKQPAGYHSIVWDASDHSSGMYFYSIQAGDFAETKKMVLLK